MKDKCEDCQAPIIKGKLCPSCGVTRHYRRQAAFNTARAHRRAAKRAEEASCSKESPATTSAR